MVAVQRGMAVEIAVQRELRGDGQRDKQSNMSNRPPAPGHKRPAQQQHRCQQQADSGGEHQVRRVGGDAPERNRGKRPAFAAGERLTREDQQIDAEVQQRAQNVRHYHRDVPADAGQQAECPRKRQECADQMPARDGADQ